MRNKTPAVILLAFSNLFTPLCADKLVSPTSELLRDALFAEEADRDLPKAEEGYREIIKKFDADRVYAASAILRLAELLRERGETKEANIWYTRILREFPDQKDAVQIATVRLGDKAAGLLAALPVGANQQAGELARITKLIGQSPDLLNTLNDGETLLSAAAAKGQLEVVKFLVSKGALIENVNVRRFPSALQAAAAEGQLEIVQFFLSQGARVNDGDEGKLSLALVQAVNKGHLSVTEHLLKAGAKYGPDLIHRAVRSGSYAVTELLLEEGMDPNLARPISLDRKGTYGRRLRAYSRSESTRPRKEGATSVFSLSGQEPEDFEGNSERIWPTWTPLEISTSHRFSKLTELLIAHGAKSQNQDGSDTEELRFAILEQNAMVVAKLLENGANPNSHWIYRSRNDSLEKKFSAVSIAASLESVEITKLLIKAGADVNKSEKGYQGAPIYYASRANMPVLISAGADPKVKDIGGNTPLHYEKDFENSKSLLAAGADLNAVNKDKMTPLTMAVKDLSAERVKVFLDAGADPKGLPNLSAPLTHLPTQRYWRSSPVSREHSQKYGGKSYGPVIRALVDAGADPNVVETKPNSRTDRSGITRTALEHAASIDEVETVRYLLGKGAKLEVAKRLACDAAPQDTPTKVELFLATYQQAERRRGMIRLVNTENGQVLEEVTALGSSQESLPKCPYSLLEAYALSESRESFSLGAVTIWREGKNQPLKFDLAKIIASGDAAKDVELAWGDLIQFASAKTEWPKFTATEKEFLENHLNRQVKLITDEKTMTVPMKLEWQKAKDSESWMWANHKLLTVSKVLQTASDSNAGNTSPKPGVRRKRYVVRKTPRTIQIERNGQKTEFKKEDTLTFWLESGDVLSLRY